MDEEARKAEEAAREAEDAAKKAEVEARKVEEARRTGTCPDRATRALEDRFADACNESMPLRFLTPHMEGKVVGVVFQVVCFGLSCYFFHNVVTLDRQKAHPLIFASVMTMSLMYLLSRCVLLGMTRFSWQPDASLNPEGNARERSTLSRESTNFVRYFSLVVIALMLGAVCGESYFAGAVIRGRRSSVAPARPVYLRDPRQCPTIVLGAGSGSDLDAAIVRRVR